MDIKIIKNNNKKDLPNPNMKAGQVTGLSAEEAFELTCY